MPTDGRVADILLGQTVPGAREDNSGALGDATFRWPHAIAGDDRTIFVADAGDHRILGFPAGEQVASVGLGQQSALVSDEFKNRAAGTAPPLFPVCRRQ